MNLGSLNKYSEYLGLGAEIAAAMVIPLIIGTYIDQRFDTKPWASVIGAFLGLLGVLNIIYKIAVRSREDDDDANEKG